MQLHVYLPALNLAFDFLGTHSVHLITLPHHVDESHYRFHHLLGSPARAQSRDKEKIAACEKVGILLMFVPYWWDRSRASLRATILDQAPHLAPHLIPLDQAFDAGSTRSHAEPIASTLPIQHTRSRFTNALRALPFPQDASPVG